MTKGKNKAFKRRQMRKMLKNSLVGGRTKMLGTLAQYGYGDGRPGRIRAEGIIEAWEDEKAAAELESELNNPESDAYDYFDAWDEYQDDVWEDDPGDWDDYHYQDPYEDDPYFDYPDYAVAG